MQDRQHIVADMQNSYARQAAQLCKTGSTNMQKGSAAICKTGRAAMQTGGTARKAGHISVQTDSKVFKTGSTESRQAVHKQGSKPSH
jgi:phage host-nuclease inhibitor protein Gam